LQSVINPETLDLRCTITNSYQQRLNNIKQAPTLQFPKFVKTAFMNTQFDLSKPVAIGADHAGYEYKTVLVDFLRDKGLKVQDFGTASKDSVDYPDFAHPVSNAVETGEAGCGILVCGSGNGVAIAANKHQGIRAAICWQTDLAKLAREHNNANIICIPARFVSIPAAEEMVNIFLNTKFEGGRHEKRVEKIACM
jgi:ribose 5-phosphate isomerase B